MSNLEKYKTLLSKEYADKISSFEKKFSEQGIDSLDTFSIILELSEALDVDLPDDKFSKIDSIEKFNEVYLKNKK